MPPEIRSRCLEPFFTTKTRSISTGLGLALVHGIVQQAGGELEIDTACGKGTTIAIKLHASQPVENSVSDAIGCPVACVSLVDQRLGSFVRAILSASGHRVVESTVPPAAEATLWLTDLMGVSLQGVHDFVDANARHHVLLFGNATERIAHPRILQLGEHPKPALVRKTLHEIAQRQNTTMKQAS
jgi:hypothetical protein